MGDQLISFCPAIRLALLSFLYFSGTVLAFEANLKVDPTGSPLDRILTNASLVIAAKREGKTDPQDILAAALADYGRLVGLLYERGYYGPVVSILIDGREAANIPPLAGPASVARVEVKISTGPAFHLGIAEISPLTPATEIPGSFKTGMPAETSVIRSTALAGVNGWRLAGHAKASVERQDITADHAQARLDVHLGIEPGPLAQFGDVIIVGASDVREDRIRSMAGITPGKVFDPVATERAAARLRRSGAFSSVTLREADALGPGNTMNLELALVDAKPRRFGFGAELQSTEGVNLSGFWMHRNFLGGAERMRIEGEVSGLAAEPSGVDYRFSAGLTRPSTFNADTDFYVLGEIERLEEPLFQSRQATTEIGINRYMSESLSAGAAIRYRFSDAQDDLGSRQFSHITLPVALTWDLRDDPLNTTQGIYLHSELMPYLGLGGSASGGRGYLDARVYRALGAEDGVVIAGRLQFGTIVGSSIAETPPDLLFFSGGSGTVRGHAYQSLSIAAGGNETGGRSFLGLAGEVRAKVSEKISAVAFYDAGYIGANSWVDDSGSWHSGAGVGIRYQTGIGPIRLDVAAPMTGSSVSDIQFYIGIGQAF